MKNQASILTRRDFVRGTASAIAVGGTLVRASAAPARSATVVVVRDQKAMTEALSVNAAALNAMLEETVKRVTGAKDVKSAWLSLVGPKDRIGLVPTPHLNPTHDELVEAVKASLVAAGIPEGNIVMAQGRSASAIRECTALISLPGLKAHWLTGIGTVLKNYIMFSGNPSAYHEADSVKLGEIWSRPDVKGKTKLVLVDALRPLCDKGPQPDPRYMWPYKGLIAGVDPVAVESICLKIITEKRRALRGEPWPLSPPPLCVKAADVTHKLGVSDLAQIKVDAVGWNQEMLL